LFCCLLTTAAGAVGCRADRGGLEVDAWGESADAHADVQGDAHGDALDATPPTVPLSRDAAADGSGSDPRDAAAERPLSPDPPSGLRGAPVDVGCADGSREGFADLTTWPRIAGCSGGFRVPGLEGDGAREPQCEREAGNTGANPSGVGCSVADLCAVGWQICADAGDVVRRSHSGCVGAVPAGHAAFFLVRAGASSDGLCIPGARLHNDLQGCGSFGDPAHPSCAPLDRRLDFAACYATRGLWFCGDDQTHLQETAEVSKAGPGLGGVLCCK
jgi:hypothetical protein